MNTFSYHCPCTVVVVQYLVIVLPFAISINCLPNLPFYNVSSINTPMPSIFEAGKRVGALGQ